MKSISASGDILAVDMGNTSVSMGAFSRAGLLSGRAHALTHAFTAASIKRLPLLRRRFSAALISSVVPDRTTALARALKASLGCPVYVIGRDLPVPVVNRAKRPKQVGIDRLINALEAFEKLKAACIAVDFGTAITFDVISKNGEYLGGVIAPGIELTLNALFEKTALLPRIRLKHPHAVLGRTTEECVRSGCSYGLGALCDGILVQLIKESKTPYRVIATGGYARYMARYSHMIQTIDEDLNLKGIFRVWQKSLLK